MTAVSPGGAGAPTRRRGPLAALYVAEAVSMTGSRMSMLALPWFVLVTTGSPVRMGLVALAEMLPYVTAQLLGGPVVDRVGAWRASVTADAVSTLAVLAIPLLHVAGLLPFWALLVAVAVAGALRAPGDSAKRVLLPRAAALAGTPLERAAGLSDGVSRLSLLLGAPVGAVLIGLLGATQVLIVDAVTFAVGAAVVAFFVPRETGRSADATTAGTPAGTEPAAAPEPSAGGASYRRDLAEGLRFVWRDPLVRAVALMLAVTNTLDAAIAGVLLPLWSAERFGGPEAVGLASGVFAGAAMAGTAVAAAVGTRLPRRLTFAVAFVLVGAPRVALFALPLPLPVVMILLAVSGLACGAINPFLAAAEYERIPAHLQARVLGALGALAWVGIPFGGLVGGVLVQLWGLTAALVVVAVVYGLATLDPFVRRAWRLMDRRPAAAGDDAADGPTDAGTDAGDGDQREVDAAVSNRT